MDQDDVDPEKKELNKVLDSIASQEVDFTKELVYLLEDKHERDVSDNVYNNHKDLSSHYKVLAQNIKEKNVETAMNTLKTIMEIIIENPSDWKFKANHLRNIDFLLFFEAINLIFYDNSEKLDKKTKDKFIKALDNKMETITTAKHAFGAGVHPKMLYSTSKSYINVYLGKQKVVEKQAKKAEERRKLIKFSDSENPPDPKNPPDLTIYGSTMVIKDELDPITNHFYNSLEQLKELIKVIPHVREKGMLHRQKRFQPRSGGRRRKSKKARKSKKGRKSKKARKSKKRRSSKKARRSRKRKRRR